MYHESAPSAKGENLRRTTAFRPFDPHQDTNAMCGRFTLRTAPDAFATNLEIEEPYPLLQPRFNIAPTQDVATVRQRDGHRTLDFLRWGLVPSWSKDAKGGARMINARAETVAIKPAFRAAFKRRRCLVVADGYYEWRHNGKEKQPHLIHFEDDRVLFFAGLWEAWKREEAASPLLTCTIITTEASPRLAHLHDRMPTILQDETIDLWLDEEVEEREFLEKLLVPNESEVLRADRVSTRVNKVQNDDPGCLRPPSGEETSS
ncbi:Putative SOS response-associated peptidase YedK [Planctomycetes bacterium Pan216]|uniref:Abasic site processing protein n=1 Tax=Kolteria novifilia TaxID=2527975 RepID=A0A518BBQ8_9BACT|nr:Putative SOS response-associated peptidase YedK [Planctomycetes bacterium Pan216]